MDIVLIILAFVLLLGSIVGCVLPILPGVPLAYAGMLLLHLTDKVEFSGTELLTWLVIVIVLQVVDYITPLLGSKYSGGTSFGNRGCMAGTLIGLFFMLLLGTSQEVAKKDARTNPWGPPFPCRATMRTTR